MFDKITSLINPKVKNIVKLRDRKHREDTGLTIVEGYKEVFRAVEAGVDIVDLFVNTKGAEKFDNAGIIDLVRERGKSIYEVTDDVFKKISYGDRNEGLIAVCKTWETSLDKLSFKKDALYVVVEGIEKPGNFGAILRTCDAVGVDAVIACDSVIDIFNPNVIRSSLGAIFE